MSYQVIILFAFAILNSFFSYFILGKGKTIINKLFSIITISVAFWSLFLGFFIDTNNLSMAVWYANIYYIAAATIPLAFFYFSLYFKTKIKGFPKKYYKFLVPMIILLIGFIVNKNLLVKEIFIYSDNIKNVILNKSFYIPYILYFVIFVIASYRNLIKNYKITNNFVSKLQFRYVFFGTTVSYVLGMIFNLFLPLENYSLIWLGPPFTLVMVISLGYAIIKHHLFSVKVIMTEMLTFTLWIFIFIKTTLSDNLNDLLINIGLLFIIIIVGILLIRSVLKEVEARERIEILAKNLEKANIKLKELDQQKSEFLSLASHQFRGPIAAIKGYASLMIEKTYGELPEKMKEPMKRIYESSHGLSLVVDDFLNVSRIEQGRMKYNFEITDISELIKEVIAELKPTIDKSNLHFEFKRDLNDKYTSKVDIGKFKQVISNLIDNSIKYTPKGSVKITVARVEQSKKIIVSIVDTGVGIPKDVIPKLFAQFKRAKNANKVNVFGTGLGLYVAKKIIEAHSGKIWVTSKGEGEGASFFVELNSA